MSGTTRNLWDFLSFPNQKERDEVVKVKIIHKMQILPSELGYSNDRAFFSFQEPKLSELLVYYNNKVLEAGISYVMSIHFFNKGVLDSPHLQSNASDEERDSFACRFWFGYFTDMLFIQMQTIWDILMDILNHHYGYAFINDQRMVSKLLTKVKQDHPVVYQYISGIWASPIYQTIHQYRVKSAHYTSSINVTDTVKIDMKGVCITGQGTYEKPSIVVNSIENYITFAVQSIHGLLNEVMKEASHA